MSEVFRDFSEVFRGPLRDPLRGRFPSQRLSVLLPLIVLPLELSPKTGKIKTYTGTSPPLFSKKAMPWGKKWPVQMNLPFFALKAYVPGGSRIRPKKFEKCLPAGTGTKIYFSRKRVFALSEGPEMERIQSRLNA